MKHFERTQAPDFLQNNSVKWGNEYAEKKKEKPSLKFNWKKHGGKPVNQHIEPLLKAMTDQHCSYCDHFPPQISDDTIDHFCPKGDERFYSLAYEWTNLYSACGDCQAIKKANFNPYLLRPDAPDYSFERYFVYNYLEHEIEVNVNAPPEDQQRATITLDILGFNRAGIKDSRRHALERFLGKKKEEIDLLDFPYRFMLGLL